MANSTDKKGTGFEIGDITAVIDQSTDSSNLSTDASAKTGDFALRISTGASTNNDAGIDVPTDVTDEIYLSVWINASGAGKGIRVGVELSDATRVYVQKDSGAGNLNYDGYRNGTLLSGAEGSETLSSGAYDLLELRIKIANSGGVFNFSLNDVSDWSFSGDTQPSASSTISYAYVQVFDATGDFCRVDDWTIYTTSAPGDIRYERLKAESDTATVEWTTAFAGDNYDEIFEHPVDTNDYVYSTTTDEVDLYEVNNYTTGKQIAFIRQQVSAAYITTASTLEMLVKSGSTTDEDSSQSLTTSAAFYNRILDNDPNTGGGWTVAAINGINIGVTATVGASGTVRVYQNILELAYDQDVTAGTFTGIRASNHSIDTEDGTHLYTGKWDTGTMYVTRALVSTLAQQQATSFGACTAAEWDNKTYVLKVFAPPFGTNNYVYAYGRWNLSGDENLRLSIDGGATFAADIAPTITSGDYISEMFGTDANTLYVFVASATPANRQLHRTQDAGATWASLATLPFNVAGASLGGDGRLVIASSASGASQIAIAESPLFSTFTTATATSLPTNAKGSIVWL